MAKNLSGPKAKAKAKRKTERAPRGLDKKGVATKSHGSEQPSADANIGNRKKIIANVMKRLDDVEARMEMLRGEKQEQMARVKALSMKAADFTMARRFYKLEGDDRDQLFDTLHEVFDTLGIGGQLDFLGTIEQDEERRVDAATMPLATVTKAVSSAETIAKAKARAVSDSEKGRTAINPYEDGTPEALAYAGAYSEQQRQIAAKFGEPAASRA